MNRLKGAYIVAFILAAVFFSKGCGSAFNAKAGDCDEFYVDTVKGLDTNPGSCTQPFQTLERAQRQVRHLIAVGLEKNVEVILRGGMYYLETPWLFEQSDSVPDGFTVTYRSQENETAEIVGGKPITKWQEIADGLYKATLPAGWTPSALMENGVAAVKARTPNEGYAAAGPKSKKMEDGRFQLDLGGLTNMPHFSSDGVQAVVWPGQHKEFDNGKNYDWFCSLLPVAGTDWDNSTVILKEDGHMPIYPRNRFYLRGAKEFIDQPGEFAFDSSEGVLYYKPRQLPIDRQEIVAAAVEHTLWIEGELDKPIQNIRFKNIRISLSNELPACFYETMMHDIQITKWKACFGMVQLTHTKNITFEGCHIRNAGMSGIAMSKLNIGHRVTDCLIENNGGNGICVWGYGIGDMPFKDEVQAYVNKNHLFENNHIRRCGQLIGHQAGIEIHQAGDIEIAHNLFEQLPRYGVAAFTTTFMNMTNPRGIYKGIIYGKKVTWENHYDFNFCRNINVHHNEIRYAMGDSQDGGGINFFGVGLGNKVVNNYVHHCRSEIADGQVMGIYIDDHSNHFVVQNNIISRIGPNKYTVPLCIKGTGNVIENNIIADSPSQVPWGVILILQTPMSEFVDWISPGQGEERTDDLVFRRNIIYRCGDNPIYSIFPWSDKIVKESDYNVFYCPDSRYEMKIDWAVKPWEFWTSAFEGRYEQHTLRGIDPLFRDPNSLDYQLSEESPAFKLGFKQIDVSQIGPRKK